MKNKTLIISIISITLIMCIIDIIWFNLEKIDDRNIHKIDLPKKLIEEIKKESTNLHDSKIIDYSLEKTAKLLKFSFEENINLNSISYAHCVTYSRVCATICNIAFEHNNINSTAKCVVGYINFGKLNICNILSKIFKKHSNNFINHDFVEINGNGYTIFVDPTLHDLINTDLKLIKHGQ